MELNPDNPTTKVAHDHWHAIVACLLVKLDLTEVLIDADDIAKMHALPEIPTIMLHDGVAGLRLKLITQAEAAMLMARETVGSAS